MFPFVVLRPSRELLTCSTWGKAVGSPGEGVESVSGSSTPLLPQGHGISARWLSRLQPLSSVLAGAAAVFQVNLRRVCVCSLNEASDLR